MLALSLLPLLFAGPVPSASDSGNPTMANDLKYQMLRRGWADPPIPFTHGNRPSRKWDGEVAREFGDEVIRK
jgi:hypothetical protein